MRCTGRGFAVAAFAVAALLMSAVPVGAQQSDPAITGFKLDNPFTVVGALRPGPDGALWFTWLQDTAPLRTGVGRVTTSGVVTQWSVPSVWNRPALQGLASGDGSIWTADAHDGKGFIGQWTVGGVLVQEFPLSGSAAGLTWGPDGALWFTGAVIRQPVTTGNSYIGRLAMDGTITTYPMPDPSNLAVDITLGSDGAFWFVEEPGANVGRVTTTGVFTEYPIPNDPGNLLTQYANQMITVGFYGAVWLTTKLLPSVTRVSPTGDISSVPGPGDYIESVTTGSDANLWFTVNSSAGTHSIDRMTLAGQMLIYALPDSFPPGLLGVITLGPDGKLWFGGSSVIGRLDPSI